MGVAGIKQLPCPSKIASFSGNLNGEAFLKVSFKNVDWFQIYKALKWKIEKKNLFFLLQSYRAFQWYIVCFHTLRTSSILEVLLQTFLFTNLNGFEIPAIKHESKIMKSKSMSYQTGRVVAQYAKALFQ